MARLGGDGGKGAFGRRMRGAGDAPAIGDGGESFRRMMVMAGHRQGMDMRDPPRKRVEIGVQILVRQHADHQLELLFLQPLAAEKGADRLARARSEEHTSELQSLMRISYAGFCLKHKNIKHTLKR